MSEWIKWEGGDCPVQPNTLVDVQFFGGAVASSFYSHLIGWGRDGSAGFGDVVAYRVVKQQSMEEAYEQTHREIGDSALDVQVGGDHYKQYKIQPVEYIHANKIPFIEGNVIKYVTRWRSKGGIADLQKAIHKLQMLIELEGK